MKKNKSRKGFTIVELVIVIAVIAILAAVLIPTFSNVIEKANHSAALQEARNKYLEVFADDIAEDGVLNINVTEAEGKGYTYTTAEGKVTEFTFKKNNGITVTYNGTTDKWSVNGESQGGTCTNGHTPEDDDDNCATPVVCTECSAEVTPAKEHNFTDAWEKDETGHWHVCQNEGCNQRQDFDEHTPGAAATEDADQICTICEYVITPALGHTHDYTIPGYDETDHWLACTCGDTSSVTPHTAADDDGDCSTAITCTGCEFVFTAALSHTNTDGDVKCDNANCKHVMPSLHLPFDNGAAGKVGTAINLNNNSYSTEYSHPSDGFTASFWIKIPEANLAAAFGAEAPLFTNKDWESGKNSGYILFLGYTQNPANQQNDPNLGYWLKFNSGTGTDRDDILTEISSDDLQDWLHITVVVDRENDQVKASFNFEEFQVLGTFNCDSFTEDTLSIGKDINGNYPFGVDIYMDDFMLFDKALDGDDVAALKAYYGIGN